MVNIESRMDKPINCQVCRTDPAKAHEDFSTTTEIRIFEVTIKPMKSGNGIVFTFCRGHLRDFIRSVNHAGVSAMGAASRMDNMLETQFEGKVDQKCQSEQ